MAYKKYKPARPPKPRYTNNLISQGKSKEELEVFNMIRLEFPDLKIYESDRVILSGRELDIWIPSLRIGIEYNGLFFHNSNTKSSSYHLWKTVQCYKQGIRLIQIFSDEWEMKKYLVIDTIKKALGKYKEIDGNDCICTSISKKEAIDFLSKNELSNINDADDYIGLIYNNALVSVLSLKNIDNKQYEIVNKSDVCKYRVINSFPKYIEEIKILHPEIKSLTAIIDRRLHDISFDYDIGHSLIEFTEPIPYYTKDFKSRRLIESFRKKTDEQLSKSGYVKVYDCGKARIKIDI